MPEIIVVSVTPWEGDYLKSTVELSKELSARNRVWFMDYQFTWKDLLAGIAGLNKSIPWKRMLGLEKRTRVVRDYEDGAEVIVYTPWPIIPAFWAKYYGLFSFINRLNQHMVLRPFRKMLRRAVARPVVVMSALNPFMGLGVKKFFPDLPHVYYCFDEIRAAHWLKIFGGQAEARLLPQVDGAIFTSDYLKKIKGEMVRNATVIKNGVHFDAFAKHRRKAGRNQPPRVGYLGSIDDRFDIDLMEDVIRRMPELEFHFVGRVVWQEVPNRLRKYQHVQFFPPVAAEEVPPIMGGMDIGVIPYIKNDFTQAVYPLKVNEYLSVGLPVIMTSFADLPDFTGVVDLADDPEAFIQCIKSILAGDDEKKIEERLAFAAANSWKSRAEDLEKYLFSFT